MLISAEAYYAVSGSSDTGIDVGTIIGIPEKSLNLAENTTVVSYTPYRMDCAFGIEYESMIPTSEDHDCIALHFVDESVLVVDAA